MESSHKSNKRALERVRGHVGRPEVHFRYFKVTERTREVFFPSFSWNSCEGSGWLIIYTHYTLFLSKNLSILSKIGIISRVAG